MTSTKKTFSVASAVSLSLSMASTAVFTAVSKPMHQSVPGQSLSMVAGMSMTAVPCSPCSAFAPRNVPSPPMATRPSILKERSTSAPFARPSTVQKSGQRSEPRKTPPR